VLIALAIGIFFWIRSRRRRPGVTISDYPDEAIPLHDNRAPSPNGYHPDDEEESRRRKGKGRAESEVSAEAIFNVGDSDGEEDEGHRQ
jgi:carboxypeptidase D